VKEAILYQKLSEKKVRCEVCQRKCLIPEGGVGYCKTRINRGGKLYTTIYGVVSSLNNDPIEKKPVFHFAPGSFCLSAGTFGCNFRCLFCLPPGTLVLTEKGIQPIENLQQEIPLKVFTHSGKLKEIKKFFSHPYNGELIKIKPYYGLTITCTPSHSLFVTLDPEHKKIEKIAAKDLTLNHYLVIPKKFSFFKKITFDLYQILFPFQNEYKKSRKTSPEDISKILRLSATGVSSKKIGEIFNLHPAYIRKLRSHLKKIGVNNQSLIWEKNIIVEKNQKIKFKTEKTPYLPRFISLTPQLARLLGLYCAEG